MPLECSRQCELSNTVIEVKEIIAAQCDVPANQQRLIYSGKVLKDPETLASYNVQEGHTVSAPPPRSWAYLR